MHVHGDDEAFGACGGDDFVGLVDGKAHGFFGNDVNTFRERGEDGLGVEIVRRGDGEDVEIGNVAEDVVPRSGAVIGAGLVAGPLLEMGLRAAGGGLGACGNGDEIELHRGEVACPFIKAHAGELPADSKALKIGVSAEMDIAAKHAGADEGNLDGVSRGPPLIAVISRCGRFS